MTKVTENDSLGLLIIRLSNIDVQEQDAASQIKNKLGFIVDSANISQLLINIEEVTFLSSEAIGQLIMLKKKCDQKEIALALSNISPEIMQVLKIVRCDEIIDCLPDQQTAIETLQKTLMPIAQSPLPDEAVEALKNKSESGDIEASFELAQRKADGRGVPQDVVGAAVLFQIGAETGHSESQFELATCYAFGLGVPQDYSLAIPWYEKAAQQGHADSQYMLGMSMQYALNDTTDSNIAKQWYEKAAEQGHSKAKKALQDL